MRATTKAETRGTFDTKTPKICHRFSKKSIHTRADCCDKMTSSRPSFAEILRRPKPAAPTAAPTAAAVAPAVTPPKPAANPPPQKQQKQKQKKPQKPQPKPPLRKRVQPAKKAVARRVTLKLAADGTLHAAEAKKTLSALKKTLLRERARRHMAAREGPATAAAAAAEESRRIAARVAEARRRRKQLARLQPRLRVAQKVEAQKARAEALARLPPMLCEWQGCSQSFQDVALFRSHLADHARSIGCVAAAVCCCFLSTLSHTLSVRTNRKQDVLECKWKGCEHPPFIKPRTLRLHAQRHAKSNRPFVSCVFQYFPQFTHMLCSSLRSAPALWTQDHVAELSRVPRGEPADLATLLGIAHGKEVDDAVTAFLPELSRLQKRIQSDKIKAAMRQRYVVGLRQVLRDVQCSRAKLVVLARRIEAADAPGTPLAQVREIVATAKAKDIPVVVALSRKKLGDLLHGHPPPPPPQQTRPKEAAASVADDATKKKKKKKKQRKPRYTMGVSGLAIISPAGAEQKYAVAVRFARDWTPPAAAAAAPGMTAGPAEKEVLRLFESTAAPSAEGESKKKKK